jgi:hypothetical protein
MVLYEAFSSPFSTLFSSDLDRTARSKKPPMVAEKYQEFGAESLRRTTTVVSSLRVHRQAAEVPMGWLARMRDDLPSAPASTRGRARPASTSLAAKTSRSGAAI